MTGVLRFEIQHGIFQERSLFPQQQMGSELVLELGREGEGCKKEKWRLPQLYCCQYNLAL